MAEKDKVLKEGVVDSPVEVGRDSDDKVESKNETPIVEGYNFIDRSFRKNLKK